MSQLCSGYVAATPRAFNMKTVRPAAVGAEIDIMDMGAPPTAIGSRQLLRGQLIGKCGDGRRCPQLLHRELRNAMAP